MHLTELNIRDERPSDAAAISALTAAAFADLEISSHTEQYIVEALRAAAALSLSLVAEQNGLGPVSVLPAYQRGGAGSALINHGLARLRASGAAGCCLVGHPQYYPRFGFKNIAGLGLEGVPAEVFFALAFDEHYPQGQVSFHPAFQAGSSPA
jgi:putative acetyltransferase